MPPWLLDIPMDFWGVLAEMGPYLLFGFFAAGVLSVLISPGWIERNLGGGGVWPILKASAFGVPLPLCSCSVIPVSTSIRRHGASKGATTAFLISTPQTGVDSIFATLSLLGWVYAIYRPIVALITGLLGGAAVSLTGRDDPESDAPSEACHEACCHHCEDQKQPGRFQRAVLYGFVTLPRDIGLTLLIGIAAAALISALIPEGYFSELVPRGPLQILVLMLAGIPVYICATASIPVAAGLIVAGVSPGAAFALLMTGPATNAATVATIWKVLGRRACLVYMATIMAGGFFGGLLLDQILTPQQIHHAMKHAGWMPMWVKHASAVVLLAVLVVGIFTGRKKHSHES
ncbi:MAG: SO_0444 family Cu/Zn efflux transporter [Phycisphaerae bacterium]|nr:SO_0444 family Cu/Zn efflux transporter [Phycisphaerae bacterium]